MMEDCESVVAFEGHDKANKEMNSESRLDCKGKGERMRVEDATLGEANSANLQINYPTEPNYRFRNRRKKGSYLSVSKKDYQKLASGKSLAYVDSKSGSLITIHVVSKDRKQPHVYGGIELERHAPSIPIVRKKQEDVDDMDSVISYESLMDEDSSYRLKEKVKDKTRIVDIKERNQNTDAACSMKTDQVPSHVRSKHGRVPTEQQGGGKRVADPKLYMVLENEQLRREALIRILLTFLLAGSERE